jgi:hypothetical protein
VCGTTTRAGEREEEEEDVGVVGWRNEGGRNGSLLSSPAPAPGSRKTEL